MKELTKTDFDDLMADRRFRLGRLISNAHEMYSMLNEAMNALRCVGVGDTRYAMTQANDIERLLRRIDGKEVQS